MPTFAGRVEAKIVVPSGGAAVSASNSGGGATTVTVPAASYYLTQAGGVSSLITTLQTQLNTSRAPTSGSWTVSFSTTTGLVSISCDSSTTARPSFSLDWLSTELRNILGFQYNINYPTNAAELARQVGYGTWTTGAWYALNEASGNCSSTFGSPATLTASGTPSYSNQGPRGGGDLAIGVDTSGTDYFDGGNAYDISGTDDLIVVWVARHPSAPAGVDLMISKGAANDVGAWAIFRQSDAFVFRYRTGSANTDITTSSFAGIASGEWYVGIASIDRSTGKARIGVKGLTSGTTATSSDTTVSGTLTNASTLRIGNQAIYGGLIGTAQYAALGLVKGSGVATGLNANLSTALSNFAATFGTWTGTQQAEGVFFPDCPLNLDGDPYQAPIVSDLRTSQSPTGVVLGLTGNTFRRQRGIVWGHVPRDRAWESAVTYANASWEHFFQETQLGLGASWFTPSSPVQIYWSNAGTDTLLGGAYNNGAGVSGWSIVGVPSVEPKKTQGQWTGLWRIELPELISSG